MSLTKFDTSCFISKFYFRSHSGVLDLILNIIIVLFTWALLLLLLLLAVATIDLTTDLSGVLAAERQKFLERHDLVVELDFPLGEGPVALLRIRGRLGQLADFLRDGCDFSAVVRLLITLFVAVLLVVNLLLLILLLLLLQEVVLMMGGGVLLMVLLLLLLRAVAEVDGLAVCIDVVEGLVDPSHILHHHVLLGGQIFLAAAGSTPSWPSPHR